MEFDFRRKVGIAALVILLSIVTLAQTSLGRLAGTVRDATGAVISNANVTITNTQTNQTATSTTTGEGAFIFVQLMPATYSVKIEAAGFRTVLTTAKVDPGKETSLNTALEVGATEEVVEVVAGGQAVDTTTSEVTTSISMDEVRKLPLLGRNPLGLINAQAGTPLVLTRVNTSINGGRPTWTQVTQDGINIQDNFIRTNSLDFVPNRPTTDSIGEFTITSNNQGADQAGGSSQVKLFTPSGTKNWHGSVYEFNRNSALAANTWFNNRNDVDKPYLNRNQFGFRLGGPILRDRLFISGNYEGFRQVTTAPAVRSVQENDDYFTGVFRYNRVDNGQVEAVNIITVRPGVTLDPVIQSLLSQLPSASLVNDPAAIGGPNIGGFRFNRSDINNRNQASVRMDFEVNAQHHLEGVFQRFTEADDRTDIDPFNTRPKAATSSGTKFYVGAWRWTVSSRLSNEFRFGGNKAPVAFNTTETYPDYFLAFGSQVNPTLTGLGVHAPYITFVPQGRDTRTYQYMDNASYLTGKHSFQFGGSTQRIKVRPYNFVNFIETVSTGFSTAFTAANPTVPLVSSDFPGGASTTDRNAANALRAFLGGVISSVGDTFRVTSKDSGFQSGIADVRNFTLDNWSFYFQDSWRMRPNLTIRAGLKWEYFSPLKEDNGLALTAVVPDGVHFRDALLDPNASVDFVQGGFYKKDLNNLGPSVGFAYDPFSDGKTSIRGGYTLTFINEETVTVGRNAVVGNAGLETRFTLTGLTSLLRDGVPTVPTPAFQVPRTFLNQSTLVGTTEAGFLVNPNIRQPYVHQLNLGVQRELPWRLTAEARYVGTLGRKIWRGVDFNQQTAPEHITFVQNFLTARNNGFLALAATGVFNPAFNGAIPGSQPVPFLSTTCAGPSTTCLGALGGLLSNATVRSLIQQNQITELANFYVGNRWFIDANGNIFDQFQNAGTIFLPNPNIYVADAVINGADLNYHGMQAELRRRMRGGLSFNLNYTWSKAISSNVGTSQARFEPYLDNDRPELERTRSIFDLRHVVKLSQVYELPFGRGKALLGNANGALDRIVGGWSFSSIAGWQTGGPFSINSNRGTFNRSARSSGLNTALSGLTPSEISDLFGFFELNPGTGACPASATSACIYYINPTVIGAAGRAVGTDTLNNTADPNFNQVFFHPGALEIGNLPRYGFSGPNQFQWDFAVAKNTRITEQVNVEVRAEFFNFPNHPTFFVGDQDINSTNFGRITSTNVGSRITQLSLRVNF